MGTPGSNLLLQALTVIVPQTIAYYKALPRTTNAVGQYVTTYDSPVNVRGSFQAVPRNMYQAYGLDFQKNYYTFYTLNDIIDLQRDVSNDQIVFNNQRFQCESNNDWFAVDHWKGVLCCLIRPGS